MSRSFLDLNRQFMPFKDEKDWELSYVSFGSEGYNGGETWDTLAQHRRIVLLAEAGAGKTAELRAASVRFKSKFKGYSFYVTLNAVAQNGLVSALETVAEKQLFNEWMSSSSEMWLFVDSLDEARLNGATFQQALSKLQQDLYGNLHRARILVSCRVSDWRSLSDKSDYEKYLGEDCEVTESPSVHFSTADEALLTPVFETKESEQTDSDESILWDQSGGRYAD